MNIIVCIKQVPGTSNVEMDKNTGVLLRDGVESKMNPYDLYALETGLWIKEKTGGTITAVTMGPSQAESVIRETFMMGIDEGYLFCDRKFAGADVLATSYTLSQGIEALGEFNLIICGRQTTDGDTAQVGPAIAEYLGIPHVTWVNSIDEVDDKKIVVEQDMADSVEVVELEYPCLITVERDIMQPRLPSYRLKLKNLKKKVITLGFSDFADRDEEKYGLKGSPTQVEKIFPPESNIKKVLWEENGDKLAEKCYQTLKKLKFI